GWLGWVALVPLLSLVRARASGKRLFRYAWLCGLVFFWPALQWMRVADDHLLQDGYWRGFCSLFEGKFPFLMHCCWALLATYCALYIPLAIWLLRKLDQGTRLPLLLTVPVVWTGLEFVRSWLLTGFAWY